MTDYVGNGGTSQSGNEGWGIMGNGSDGVIVRCPLSNDSTLAIGAVVNPNHSQSVAAADIPDGASNTIMLGEKNFNIGRSGFWQPEDDAGYIEGWDFDTIRWGYVPPMPDDDDFRDTYNNTQYRSTALRTAFGSSHPGIFNTVFADGSVRAIHYSVSFFVWECLSSRNDGQTVDPNAY